MGRRKLVRLRDLDTAKARLAAITSIDSKLDLGNGLTAAGYDTLINSSSQSVKQYNSTLSLVDDHYNKCQSDLLELRDYSERMLNGIASKYGKNSSEYEMAGGTRKSERKKPVSKKKAVTA